VPLEKKDFETSLLLPQKRTLLDIELTGKKNSKLNGGFLIARPHFFQWFDLRARH